MEELQDLHIEVMKNCHIYVQTCVLHLWFQRFWIDLHRFSLSNPMPVAVSYKPFRQELEAQLADLEAAEDAVRGPNFLNQVALLVICHWIILGKGGNSVP